MSKHNHVLPVVLLTGLLLYAGPAAQRAAAQEYNKAFLTDTQLRDTSWSEQTIRDFIKGKGGYFKVVVLDTDNTSFDLAKVIAEAAKQYKISPKVLLATLQKECSGVTRTTRPNMAALMGISGSTGRAQITNAAYQFDKYQRDLEAGKSTVSGWKKGVAKTTQDGVKVTPATNAVAGQFSYTPYAGDKWGGNKGKGGVWLFYSAWTTFGF